LDAAARDAVDSAVQEWGDAERAWLAIEWALARDPHVGVPLTEKGNIRGFVYHGARSIGQPDVWVIYEIEQDEILVRDAMFSDAKSSQSGRG
jgi:hypothetical protein